MASREQVYKNKMGTYLKNKLIKGVSHIHPNIKKTAINNDGTNLINTGAFKYRVRASHKALDIGFELGQLKGKGIKVLVNQRKARKNAVYTEATISMSLEQYIGFLQIFDKLLLDLCEAKDLSPTADKEALWLKYQSMILEKTL